MRRFCVPLWSSQVCGLLYADTNRIAALHKCPLLISSCFLSNGTGDTQRKYCTSQTRQCAANETACRTMVAPRSQNVRSLDNRAQIAHPNSRDCAMSLIYYGVYFWFHNLRFNVTSMCANFCPLRNEIMNISFGKANFQENVEGKV